MLTIGIPQLYCGASGKKGAYNRQEIGLARAFAAQGCRAVAFYPAVGAKTVTEEQIAPGVSAVYVPAKALSVNAVYSSWQPLLERGVQAVHVMGDNSLGVPGLYHFCQKHGIFFYSVIGAVYSDASTPARRAVMDFLGRRNLAVYKKTPAYAKTPAAAAQLAAAGVPCAGVLPVGLDTAVIPKITQSKAVLRQKLGLEAQARYFVFAGRLDAYKRPLELAEILAAAPGWRAVVIGRGEMAAALDARMAQAGLAGRYRRIPELANAAVHEYYHACDAYVNCNDHEIFGMSLLEAMWAGCPVVARRAPGPELLLGAVQADVQTGAFPLGAVQIDASSPGVPGQNPPSPSGCGALPCGILVEKTSEYPAALERVAAHPEMGAAAHARVQAHFLWDAGAAQALAMLRQKGVLCDG